MEPPKQSAAAGTPETVAAAVQGFRTAPVPGGGRRRRRSSTRGRLCRPDRPLPLSRRGLGLDGVCRWQVEGQVDIFLGLKNGARGENEAGKLEEYPLLLLSLLCPFSAAASLFFLWLKKV